MNEDEKNIINKLKRQSSIEELVENESVTDTFILVSVSEAKTLLNLIKKQEKEIEKFKEMKE